MHAPIKRTDGLGEWQSDDGGRIYMDRTETGEDQSTFTEISAQGHAQRSMSHMGTDHARKVGQHVRLWLLSPVRGATISIHQKPDNVVGVKPQHSARPTWGLRDGYRRRQVNKETISMGTEPQTNKQRSASMDAQAHGRSTLSHTALTSSGRPLTGSVACGSVE